MREYRHKVAGDLVSIKVAEHEEDLDGFRDFVRGNLHCLASDSESTGLDIYAPGHRVRLWQFGNPFEAWVLPVERGGQFVEDTRRALLGVQKLIFHNASHDLQEADKHLGIPMEYLWPKTLDTKVPAHLIDPRGQDEGGIGHGLEPLVAHYIDEEVSGEVKGLMSRLAKEFKTTKAKIWKLIDIDHPEYNLYAGMDPILAARLAQKLLPKVPSYSRPLMAFEHKVAEICSYMERLGFLLDRDYAERLALKLLQDQEHYEQIAANYGVENVNSTEQVAEGLKARGVKLDKRTPKGNLVVDKTVLKPLVKQGDELAVAITEAKKARKWRRTWVETFLETADEQGRCHASINPLRARTARMSITGIPAQTLPSSDWMIRRCFVADPGHVNASMDYKTQELRVLAALSRDKTMMEIFRNDGDLHLMTARSAFGDHIEKGMIEREKYAKTANFQKVYGGGPASLAETLGIPLEVSKKIHEGFDKAYPGVGVYNKHLMKMARSQGYVITPSGRRLPVDRDRAYSALNYVVQSSSRDVTCRGLVRLHEAGFTPYLRLPIHDEVLASLPREHAEEGSKRIAQLMAEEFGGLEIGTDSDVLGKSWGHGYMRTSDGAPDLELMEKADEEIRLAGLW